LFAIHAVDQQVLNVSTPTTVDKATFYQAALESAQLKVDFPPVVAVEDKRIVVDKLLQSGFQFQYQSTLDAL
ncbi:TPA: SDR family NAD(P)-dependent oxidoreductase, partial [Vibrio vulnificus]|nr:SDR family NAD(P)-dependent oxidoreductase [Vibrio vulnificus]HDY8128165.1 SDR family NAD(P)-dependent oxidoreductase [Vibrio vulnificus]